MTITPKRDGELFLYVNDSIWALDSQERGSNFYNDNSGQATIEVRLSNLPARRLYEKYGFRPVGLRPRYYSDNGEDALIMTTDPLADAPMCERIDCLRAAVDAAPAPTRPDDVGP